MIRSPKIKVLTRLHSFWRLYEEIHFVFSPLLWDTCIPLPCVPFPHLQNQQVDAPASQVSLSLPLFLPLNLCLSYFLFHHQVFFTLLLSLILLPPLKMSL